jgi:hypothetical protein
MDFVDHGSKVAAGTELRKGCSNLWRVAAPHFS